MEAIEDEVVWRVDPIVHPRVAAEQIQDVPIAARIEQQARAAPPHLRVLPAGCRVRVSEGSLQLPAESVAEEEPDPAAAARPPPPPAPWPSRRLPGRVTRGSPPAPGRERGRKRTRPGRRRRTGCRAG